MSIKNITKKQLIWGGLILLLVGVIFFLVSSKKPLVTENTTTIKRGDVVQEVSVTGRVKSSKEVNLSFEKNGRIAGVYARVGEEVERGRVLAELESSSARGNLLEAEARLAELKRGSRPEELSVKKAEVTKFAQDLENAYDGIATIAQDAFAKADDALHVKTSGIFSGYKTTSYKYTVSICDSQLTLNGEALRLAAENDIDLWRAEIANAAVSTSTTTRLPLLSRAEEHLSLSMKFLDGVGRALTLDCMMSNTALDTYRANVSTARTGINTAIEAIRTKRQAIASLSLTLEKVQSELILMEAGTSPEAISAQEARVLVAQGELSKYLIISPISGVVTKADAKVGESADLARPSFSVISNVSYKIEAYIPEADIAKIKIGNMARITLDAHGGDAPFEGALTAVDPAETIVDNVPTYMTTFHFIKNDPRIKSGMTANIDIGTAVRKDVLYVPERSIITRSDKKFIRVVDEQGATSEIEVTIGLRGSEGLVEVSDGAIEGTTIVLAPKD